MQKLLEPQIKALLVNKLLDSGKIKDESVLINEFTIDKSSRRVDLALITNKRFEAFEIKSEADSLFRIEGQTSKYLEYFDKVTIISAKKHSEQIKNLFDDNIGLWEVHEEKFKVIKKGRKSEVKNKKSLISLMTVDDLKKLARETGVNPTSHKRKDLEEAFLKITTNTLRAAALSSVIQRYQPYYTLFSTKTSGRKVLANDIKLLSPNRKKPGKEKKDQSIENLISSLESI